MIEKIHKTRCGDIHYFVSDKIKAGEFTLVFLPGLSADHRLFEKQTEYFESRYNILVWDAPGHAASRPFVFDYDLTDKAEWLHEILDKEKIEKPVIVGQSMGGYVGQMFSQLYPEKLSGFISIDSAPLQREYVTAAEIWMLRRTKPLYKMYSWKALLKAGTQGVAETEYGRKLMESIMHVYDNDFEGYLNLISHGYAMLADAMAADLPYEIKCPAMLICGKADKAGSTKRYNRLWTEKTGIAIKWIEGAGHNSNTDKPVLINALIEDFIHSINGDIK